MANYSDIFPISTNSQGGAFDLSSITSDSTLTIGGFYSINATQKIGVNIESLPNNSNIAFNNIGSGTCIIYPLSQIDGINIPSNKGVALSSSSVLWLTKNSSNTGITRVGSYTLDWIPGFEPSWDDCIYVSNGDTNGILYYLGTNGRTTPFSNPYPSIVSISAYNESTGSSNRAKMTDRLLDAEGVYYNIMNPPYYNYQTFTFPKEVKINRFTVRNRNNPFNASEVRFSYFYENNWVEVPELIHSNRTDTNGAYTVSAEYEIPVFTDQIRLKLSGRTYTCHDDIEFYGFIYR